MVKKKLSKTLSYLIILVILVVALVIGIHYFTDYFKEESIITIDTENDIIKGCSNLNIVETAVCLNTNLKVIYYFNLSNTGKKLTFEQLKELGGTCEHYSELYKSAAEELGFVAELEIVDMRDKEFDHVYTRISDETAYCILEQDIRPWCVSIK